LQFERNRPRHDLDCRDNHDKHDDNHHVDNDDHDAPGPDPRYRDLSGPGGSVATR
jgi:hypothetical protein